MLESLGVSRKSFLSQTKGYLNTFLSFTVIMTLVCILLLAAYNYCQSVLRAWVLWWRSAEQVDNCMTAQHCGLTWRPLLSRNNQLWVLYGHCSIYLLLGLPLAFHFSNFIHLQFSSTFSLFSSPDTTLTMPVYNSYNLGRKWWEFTCIVTQGIVITMCEKLLQLLKNHTKLWKIKPAVVFSHYSSCPYSDLLS